MSAPPLTSRIVYLNNNTDTAVEIATILNHHMPVDEECKKKYAAVHSFLSKVNALPLTSRIVCLNNYREMSEEIANILLEQSNMQEEN